MDTPLISRAPPASLVYVLLVVVAAIWGAAFPMMHLALQDFAPGVAVGLRFGMAALAMLPWAWSRLGQRRAQSYGLGLGLLMGVIYLILAHALQQMPPPRVAFLLGTTVLFVQLPNLARGRRGRLSEWLGGVGSLIGLFVLTRCGAQPLSFTDALVLSAAALSALGLVGVRYATQRAGNATDALTFYSLATIAVVASVAALWRGEAWHEVSGRAWSALLYCGIIGGAVAQRLQMAYQRYAADAVASMIFALKPVFAAISSAFLLGHTLDGHTWLGGAIMFAAAFLPPLWQHLGQALSPRTLSQDY